MSQDPADRAPADPRAAPDPDSAWAPPSSRPGAPDAGTGDAQAGEATQYIDTSAGGGTFRSESPDTPPDGAAPSGTTSASGAGGTASDHPAAPFGSGYGGHQAPATGYHPGDDSAGYGVGGYGAGGYGAAGYGAPDPAAAYGSHPPGYPATGYPPGGHPGGYDSGYSSGGYGPPGYPGYPPQGYGVAPPTNAMAIVSLVFAFVFPPLGIVFGVIARRQTKQTGEQGEGIALAGLIIGIAFTALFALFIVVPLLFLFAVGAGATFR